MLAHGVGTNSTQVQGAPLNTTGITTLYGCCARAVSAHGAVTINHTKNKFAGMDTEANLGYNARIEFDNEDLNT